MAVSDSRKSDERGDDVVLIHGVTDDGKGLQVLRKRAERLEAGCVRPLEEGKPIQGEVVKLRPRKNRPFVCDVEVQVAATGARADAPPARDHKGPARVATDAYRKNWRAVWKRSAKKDALLN